MKAFVEGKGEHQAIPPTREQTIIDIAALRSTMDSVPGMTEKVEKIIRELEEMYPKLAPESELWRQLDGQPPSDTDGEDLSDSEQESLKNFERYVTFYVQELLNKEMRLALPRYVVDYEKTVSANELAEKIERFQEYLHKPAAHSALLEARYFFKIKLLREYPDVTLSQIKLLEDLISGSEEAGADNSAEDVKVIYREMDAFLDAMFDLVREKFDIE